MEKKKGSLFSAKEERANTITHGIGAALAVVGALALLPKALGSGSLLGTVSLLAFGLSLVILYTASAVYHGAKNPDIKRKLRVIDHCSVFILILGTYIPLSLLVVGGTAGWMLCLANTALAVLGIVLNVIDLVRFDRFCLVLYILMGWLIVLAMGTLVRVMPAGGIALLVAGGAAYSAGIFFYKSKKEYMHFVWHLFVLAGSLLHYLCVFFYCV